MNHFRSADILLPDNCDYKKWAVIACDQYTSEPEYWQNVRKLIGTADSTLQMFFPEAELSGVTKADYESYCANMQQHLQAGFFQEFPNSYIYVERTLQSGAVRQGIVGMIDLEYYDYDPKVHTKIFATEATVLQRVPPRVALRKHASLEFSHTVMFCDDLHCKLIEPVGRKSRQMQKVYDFDLMCNGGHITGYLLSSKDACSFEQAVAEYEKENSYLIGDGNHSLVTAKLTYQALKELNPYADWENHPARYAMVELENIHSPVMQFEPIYRIVTCDAPVALVRALNELDTPNGTAITWITGSDEGTVRLHAEDGELLVEALQRFLDQWCDANGGTIDYIHGADSVRSLAARPGTVGFLLPDMKKTILFPYILSGKVMPKKTFSIGHADEKRYYLEGRKIK